MIENIINNQLSYVFLGNSLFDYLVSLGFFIVLFIVLRYGQVLVINHLDKLSQKTKNDLDDTLVEVIKTIKPYFYSFLSLYLAIQLLDLNNLIKNLFNSVLLIWIIYQTTLVFQILVNYLLHKKLGADEDKEIQNTLSLLNTFIKIIVWSFGFILILSNLGINVTSLVAGLGIGGIAIAFALQKILGDLFSSFAIYLDKPFKAGDFIIVNEQAGVVEKIGIKTTRIKTLQGEELIIPNQELTSSNIRNFKKMEKRRIAFSFGVTYETSSEKLRKIPQIIKSIIEKIELTTIDRVHFKKFDDSALTYEIVYYVETNEYTTYMDIQQEINLQIKEIFEKEEIEMAFPTQTIYLHK